MTSKILPYILMGLFLIMVLSCSKDKPSDGNSDSTVRDNDGNTYKTVVIGTQTWFAENLKTTKFKDGKAIQVVTIPAKWQGLTTPACCWYNNDVTNKNPYGALYNWYAVSSQKLCPNGWHVPTEEDWNLLADFYGGMTTAYSPEKIPGSKLKEIGTTHWRIPNADATNESGFTALGGGLCNVDGNCYDLTIHGYWWGLLDRNSALSSGFSGADVTVFLSSGSGEFYLNHNAKQFGLSVRCLKDK